MPIMSYEPMPLKSEWTPDEEVRMGYSKEILGRTALLLRHCHTRMRRVIRFYRRGEHGTEIMRLHRREYICLVCECRLTTDDYPA